MKAYGSKGNWDTEDFGEPSRIRKMTGKNRHYLRRCFHKQGRNQGKQDIRKQLNDDAGN